MGLARLLTLLLLSVASGLTLPLAQTCSRRAVAATAAASFALLRQAPARADDADKKFVSCLSACVYEQTKIAKGEHARPSLPASGGTSERPAALGSGHQPFVTRVLRAGIGEVEVVTRADAMLVCKPQCRKEFPKPPK